MGVPQRRERVFIIGARKDLKLPKLKLQFNERPIVFSEVETKERTKPIQEITKRMMYFWKRTKPGCKFSSVNPTGALFSHGKMKSSVVSHTVDGNSSMYHYSQPRKLYDDELIKISSFPSDFNFCKKGVKYVVGMSVPPVMTAQIAHQIYLQWLSKELI